MLGTGVKNVNFGGSQTIENSSKMLLQSDISQSHLSFKVYLEKVLFLRKFIGEIVFFHKLPLIEC